MALLWAPNLARSSWPQQKVVTTTTVRDSKVLISSLMEYDRRNGGHRGGHHSRKRRFREDDDFGRRPPRRQYQEPGHLKIRKQLLAIAESPLNKTDEEVKSIASTVAEHSEDDEVRGNFLDLVSQLVVQQALKIPFVAAVVLDLNLKKPELAQETLTRTATALNEHFKAGAWREVKLLLRFLACLQGILEADGLFPILEELFSRAVDLQTASSEDVRLRFIGGGKS